MFSLSHRHVAWMPKSCFTVRHRLAKMKLLGGAFLHITASHGIRLEYDICRFLDGELCGAYTFYAYSYGSFCIYFRYISGMTIVS